MNDFSPGEYAILEAMSQDEYDAWVEAGKPPLEPAPVAGTDAPPTLTEPEADESARGKPGRSSVALTDRNEAGMAASSGPSQPAEGLDSGSVSVGDAAADAALTAEGLDALVSELIGSVARGSFDPDGVRLSFTLDADRWAKVLAAMRGARALLARVGQAEAERDEARSPYNNAAAVIEKRGKEIDRQMRRAEAAEASVKELRAALEDQADIDEQSAETLRDLRKNWRAIIEQEVEGEPMIENILYWLIEDVEPTEARAALARVQPQEQHD